MLVIKMNYDEKVKAAQEIHEKAKQFRGHFINSVAVIEQEIALILTEYYSRTDVPEEYKKVLRDARKCKFQKLDKNTNALLKIIKNYYLNYWDRYCCILEDIDKIRVFRNKIAHSPVDISEDALNRPIQEGVGFIEWNKGKPLSEADFQDWNARTNMIVGTLRDIKRVLPFKEISIIENDNSKK